eukprot:4012262-Prymnesium_polylepis.1
MAFVDAALVQKLQCAPQLPGVPPADYGGGGEHGSLGGFGVRAQMQGGRGQRLPAPAVPLPPPRTLDPQPAIPALMPRSLLASALENHVASAPNLRSSASAAGMSGRTVAAS